MKIPAFKKTYGGRLVLDMPETELKDGGSFAVIGANGSGKSTLARILAGIELPDCGKISLPCALPAYMPQKSYPFRMSVRANLLMGANDPERAQKLMEALHIEQLAYQPAHKLSGGETARMALARLLMKKHELLILDEPTAAMDIESVFLAEQLLSEYRKQFGCTLILVTHSLKQAERLADEVLFFDNGRLVERAVTGEFVSKPQSIEAKRFIELYGL